MLPPIEVFYSYADADEQLLNQLESHLSLSRSQNLITTWHKRQISAGTDWSQELDEHLNTASIILLLISPDFLASDYCAGVEMARAMQRYHANEARVIPILLRPADLENAPFQRLQPLPHNRRPITSWSNHDEAFSEVARAIRTVLEEVRIPKRTRYEEYIMRCLECHTLTSETGRRVRFCSNQLWISKSYRPTS